MQRIPITPRIDLRAKLEQSGFLFHQEYYTETWAYSFSALEIERLETATAEIYRMCCAVVREVITKDLFAEFFIPPRYAVLIRQSWNQDFCSFYGRLDLAVSDDCSDVRLLEFNADTPTSLLEASVIQWQWLQEFDSSYDQFNSIHEKLLEQITACIPYLDGDKKLWFAAVSESSEDFMTAAYLRDLAEQCGLQTEYIDITDIALDGDGRFCGPGTSEIELISNIFKLYPYEWMFAEEFGPGLDARTTWIEPFYKAIMSNKMLLVYLYKLFPDSPYILPAFYEETGGLTSYVKKPVFSREGANITIVSRGTSLQETDGEYGEEGFIYQQYQELPLFDGVRPVIGSWLIGGKPAGIGIKETSAYIHDNMSRFCPHFFR